MSFFNKLVIRSALFSALLLLIQPTQSTALGRTYTDRGRNRAQFEGNRSQRCAPLDQRVQTLPSANEAIQVGRDNYHYSKNNFYRRNNQGVFVVITAPLFSRVCQLPSNRIRFLIGSPRYFYTNYTCYLCDSNRPDYLVVEEPEGAETEVVAASETQVSSVFMLLKGNLMSSEVGIVTTAICGPLIKPISIPARPTKILN